MAKITKAAPTKAAPKNKTNDKAPSKTAVKAPAKAAPKAAVKDSARTEKKMITKTTAAKTGTKTEAKKAIAKADEVPKGSYDESKIKTLSSLEHIRLRSGMYIGRLGDGSNQDDGIYILIKEVIDNAIDEFIMGNGKLIETEVKNNIVKIRDFGRGIPLGKLVECVSVINTGAKYNDDVFQFSVGLNGVGTKAVNALSSHFRVVSIRDGLFAEAIFERGDLKTERKGKLKNPQKNGTYVEFTPDPDIFGDYEFNPEFIEKRIQNYTYLNAGLTLSLNGKKYISERGLYDLLHEETGDTPIYPIGYYKGERIEFAFTHTNNYGEEYFSFVNGQFTSDGIFPRSKKVF